MSVNGRVIFSSDIHSLFHPRLVVVGEWVAFRVHIPVYSVPTVADDASTVLPSSDDVKNRDDSRALIPVNTRDAPASLYDRLS